MRYMKSDVYRIVTSGKFYIGILMVALASFVSALGFFGGSVVSGFHYMGWRSTYTLVYAAAAVPFAGAFLEDGEHKFYYPQILRGDIVRYTASKVFLCFLSAVLTVGIGSMVFCYAAHIRLPWNTLDAETIAIYGKYSCLGFLMEKNFMPCYFFCYSLMRGLLAGILAVLAQWLSLYAENQLFAVALPMSAYYFLVNYLPEPFNLYDFFDPAANVLGNLKLKIPSVLFVSAVSVLIIGIFMEKKLEKDIFGKGGKSHG